MFHSGIIRAANDNRHPMSAKGVRSEKAALSSECKQHPQPFQQADNAEMRHLTVAE